MRVEFLESVVYIDLVVEPECYGLSEHTFEILADNEYNFFESGSNGVKDRVVDKRLSIRSYRIGLF